MTRIDPHPDRKLREAVEDLDRRLAAAPVTLPAPTCILDRLFPREPSELARDLEAAYRDENGAGA